jgi:hypothetical protein
VHREGEVSCSGVQRVEGFEERLTCRLVHLFVLRLWRACCVFGSFAPRRGTRRSSTMRAPLSRRVPPGKPGKQRGGTRRAASGLEARRFRCSPRLTSRRARLARRVPGERPNRRDEVNGET